MSFFSHENFRYLIKCFSQKIVVPFEKKLSIPGKGNFSTKMFYSFISR